MVGGHGAGVSAADDHDAQALVGHDFSWFLAGLVPWRHRGVSGCDSL